ncbi:MAG: EcoAI/FtnUII family type I restriction enzme subunit R [Candidatus Nanopelagicales bacterium]
MRNEAETRTALILPALQAAGWGTVEGSHIREEYVIAPGRITGPGQQRRPLKADYVLVCRHTKLAIVEAKSEAKHYTEGLGQAKDYAEKVGVRFTYATNGHLIRSVDMTTGTEADTTTYPTPQELWDATFATHNAWRDRFAAVPFQDKGGTFGGRYYQDAAVTAVMEAVAAERKRILLTLATGTGKTFIAFQIAWKLFQSRWNLGDAQSDQAPRRRPRILFLADRNILADQAFNAFSAFPEDALVRINPAEVTRRGRVPKNGSIFFTIFQTFMSGTDANGDPAPNFGEYPPDFFDFIIVDECHRGGANDESTWRAILDYFAPATQLGLTATPKRSDNVDTYAYFGEPVYVYSLKDGINDGFLTPFRVRAISTTLDEYVYTSDDTVVEGEVEAGKVYVEKDFNKVIEIKERERARVRLLLDLIDQSKKTLVFCANQTHALVVRDLINELKTSPNPSYCHRVTADDGGIGEQHLRDFCDNEKTIPTILTTSQKLSTGVDAVNVRNIVLMRPINSMIEFKQIIGRGTRLYDGKYYFTIYDFTKAHHHFSDPEWDGDPVEPDPPAHPRPGPGPTPPPDEPELGPTRPKKVRVKLGDGKERTIEHMVATSFWGPDGRPMSAVEFLTAMYGVLPALFRDEDELRSLWSQPATRRKLLEQLDEKGYGPDVLTELAQLIDAQDSDLFDVLSYVAYAATLKTRAERAEQATVVVDTRFLPAQTVFLHFVLSQYVDSGVEELATEKLAPLLKLKYGDSIQDAIAQVGPDIGLVFTGFQRYLYESGIA